MNANILAAPFVLVAAALLYFVMEGRDELALWLAGTILILAVIYILAPQINWYFQKKQPPPLPDGARRFLLQNSRFFQGLSNEDKRRFEERAGLWMNARNWQAQNLESVPEDIKLTICEAALQVWWDDENWLLDDFEQVVLFMGPFPTPQHHAWHASETEFEDKTWLFSVDHLLRAFVEPHNFPRLDLYEMCKTYLAKHPSRPFPEPTRAELEQLSGFPHGRVEAFLGLPITDLRPLAMAYRLQFADRLTVDVSSN